MIYRKATLAGKRIWCFGDSNTYGYDPRGFWGDRYAEPWPARLEAETGAQVMNDGRNGRMIPNRAYEMEQFQRNAARNRADLLIVMLGTNDLLNGASAADIAARMGAFLTECAACLARVLLIAPPPLKRGAWVPEDDLVAESINMAGRYGALAARMGIGFADAGQWHVELAYDGVHFSEEGHAQFARGAAAALNDLLCAEIGH